MADAAQEFLDKQLSKNRFTAKQQARLDASGGAAVVNASEGVVPGGGAYAKYGPEPGSSSTSTSTSNGLQGSKSADEIRKEFGLIYDKSNAPQFDPNANKGKMQTDDGHMWYKDSAGQTQYLGQVAGEYKRGSIGDGKSSDQAKMKGSDKSMFHGGGSDDDHKSTNDLLQRAHDERNGEGHSNGFNSINDVANAMRHMLDAEKKAGGAPKEERTPIEHSPEVKQATERVRAYEDNIMSGKTSEDIFGSYDTDLDLNKSEPPSAQATPTEQASTRATESFLDNKKHETKIAYNFKPKTDLSYGAN
mgnify:CR=1 FL=1